MKLKYLCIIYISQMFLGYINDIPSGDVKIAIENGHVCREFSH